MKRLYVALALIAASLIICITSNLLVEKQALNMRADLSEISAAIKSEDKEKTSALFTRAQSRWKKTESIYSLIVDADKIEEVSINFSIIKDLLSDGNTEHALERLHECELMLAEITENEKLSIKNIM